MNWGYLRTVEYVLAVAVLLVVVTMSSTVPVEYPSWPTLGEVPVDPELLVPGALGAVVIANAVRDGLTIWSVGIGALGAITLLLAMTSLHTLYASTGGCVFFGGFLTLSAGVPLAALVLGRRVFESVSLWYRRRTAASG